MKTAIILHGMPDREEYYDPASASQSNKHWIPWIQRQLCLKDILAQTPEMPEPYAPDYEKWKAVFEQFHVDKDTMLVGHSCGGGFLVRWLSEHKDTRVGKVALVAPWVDPDGRLVTDMFKTFILDQAFISRTEATRVFISNERLLDVQTSVDNLKRDIPKFSSEAQLLLLMISAYHSLRQPPSRSGTPAIFDTFHSIFLHTN